MEIENIDSKNQSITFILHIHSEWNIKAPIDDKKYLMHIWKKYHEIDWKYIDANRDGVMSSGDKIVIYLSEEYFNNTRFDVKVGVGKDAQCFFVLDVPIMYPLATMEMEKIDGYYKLTVKKIYGYNSSYLKLDKVRVMLYRGYEQKSTNL